jgi:hypothetical protein
MKLDVRQHLLDYEGKPGTQSLRETLSICLNNVAEGEQFTPEDKNKIFQLTTKIFSNNNPDLTVDDRSFIKVRAGKIFTPLMYGRVCELMEGNEPAVPPVKKDEDEDAKENKAAKPSSKKEVATIGAA